MLIITCNVFSVLKCVFLIYFYFHIVGLRRDHVAEVEQAARPKSVVPGGAVGSWNTVWYQSLCRNGLL